MPSQGTKSKPGSRYTKPRVPVRDVRDGRRHDESLVAGIRRAATGDRLGLDGLEHLSVPQHLAGLRYECDRSELTAFGGLPLFAQFAYGLGLADLVCGLPMAKRESQYSPGKLCEAVVMALAGGLERISHVDDYTHDPGLCESLGVDRLPDQGTFSRLFSAANGNAVRHLREANRSFSQAATCLKGKERRLVVDSDTRVVGVYGKQEGTVRSRRNAGKPHFTFEITTLRNSYDILDGGLLRGATHPVPLFKQRFQTVLKQLASQTKELVWCADAAWYAGSVLQDIEAADADPLVPCSCKYVIRVQLNARHLEAIQALPEEAWQPCAEGIEIAEYWLGFRDSRSGADPVVRRHIVTRKAKPKKAQSAAQVELLPVPAFEYGALVTNLSLRPKVVWVLYNNRSTVESILRESALGFHMDSLPSATFAGNELFCQLLVLAYNLVNLFRRLCFPEEHCRHHVQGLRRMFLAIPAAVERTAKGLVLHCASHGPHAQLLPVITQRLQVWFCATGPGLPAPQPT